LALADFIAPQEAGIKDHVGLFAVSAGFGISALAEKLKKDKDDYSLILAKALAGRLAEAFAERLHARVRKEFWGYAAGEHLTQAEVIAERYQGIRPAPGYPACPEHSEKKTIFELLKVEKNIGICLTENFAMDPAASVSGFYFAHPKARYFAVGKISKDQVSDYAARKGISPKDAERLLSENLNYNVQS
jgi:5-methyltetrahydrofolate--homocysteine methyltransferase